MADTKELIKLDPKTARIKVWMPLITAIVSLAGVIVVAVLQFGAARESSVKEVVKQINENVIPRLEIVIQEVTRQCNNNTERIAKVEGKLEERDKPHRPVRRPVRDELPPLVPVMNPRIEPGKHGDPGDLIKLPKIQMEQSHEQASIKEAGVTH